MYTNGGVFMREERHHHRGGRNRGEHRGEGTRAKTFRRKKVVLFLQSLEIKRDTLAVQLTKAEFQQTRAVIEGELKAIELVIAEFKATFHVDEQELTEVEE